MLRLEWSLVSIYTWSNWVLATGRERLTEEVRVTIGGKVWDADNDCCTGSIDIVSRDQQGTEQTGRRVYLHTGHTENTRQSTFSPTTHLQVPHKDNGQQAQGEIANHGHHTVDVCDGDKLVDLQTGPVASPIPKI